MVLGAVHLAWLPTNTNHIGNNHKTRTDILGIAKKKNRSYKK